MKRYDDFIGVYPNAAPEGFCKHLIEQFEMVLSEGAGQNRIQSENTNRHIKDDLQYVVNLKGHVLEPFNGRNTVNVFFDTLQNCFNDYTSMFSVLKDIPTRTTHMKMQKSLPGHGYHVWHAEQGPNESSNRVLTYLFYLNTLNEDAAGETEFLYQKKRFKPVENTMIIWPAAYTHAHRGNVVFGTEPKYVVTGWFYID